MTEPEGEAGVYCPIMSMTPLHGSVFCIKTQIIKTWFKNDQQQRCTDHHDMIFRTMTESPSLSFSTIYRCIQRYIKASRSFKLDLTWMLRPEIETWLLTEPMAEFSHETVPA